MPAVIRTAVTLSAGQAAGTTAVLTANPNRQALTAGNPTAHDMRLDVTAPGAGEGIPLTAGSIVGFGRDMLCPTQALYVGGGTAGDVITFWEV